MRVGGGRYGGGVGGGGGWVVGVAHQHPATLPEVSGTALERKKSSLLEAGASYMYVTASSDVSLAEVDSGSKSA